MLDLFVHPLRLHADPSRVVVRPFHIAWASGNGGAPSRSERLVRQVLAMSPQDTRAQLETVLKDFEARHWQTRRVFMTRYDEIEAQLGLDGSTIGDEKRQLIGAYFCHEYSYAAAALMNPSVVPHFDQTGMPDGSMRILMSMRAVGEGHISSVAFREGIITDHNEMKLAPEPPFATAADAVGDEEEMPVGPVTVYRHRDSTLSGTVIFPITEQQSKGLEDLRLVHFTHDDGEKEWIGTYTAYNGASIQSEMMRTKDFRAFDLVPMSGAASRNKGMALFPRKVGGRYMMIGRQDGQNIFIIDSDRLDHWDEGQLLLEPKYPWELVQMGNCGPPIETDAGWILLTHGVGAMRKYSIGAALLDKDDPTKVIGRTKEPILAAADQDREGYVPNVVYTCGAVRQGDSLFIPYGIADSSIGFAFVEIDKLIATMR
ncbi:glycoside hydrolase family 130 protein [Sphingomonas sp. RS2018]